MKSLFCVLCRPLPVFALCLSVGSMGCSLETLPYQAPDKPAVEQAEPVDRSQMVAIEAGTFSMGHPPADPGMYGAAWKENEMPAHAVTLSAFWIEGHEVTNHEFAKFLSLAAGEKHYHPLMGIERDGNVDYRAREKMEAHPVSYVSYEAAAEYCAWRGMRLPTEAEWERAAKGLDDRRWPWGDEGPNCQRSNHYRGSSYCQGMPVAVSSHSPAGDSLEGVHDLAGNVAEWVHDLYAPYGPDPADNPRGPDEGWWRVVRGGGFNEARAAIRTTARWAVDPTEGSAGIGFRCAVGAEEGGS